MPKPVPSGGVPAVPEFRPVAADVFVKRAQRLKVLARGHAMGEYLRFAAALAHAQAKTFASLTEVKLADEAQIAHCREHGLPLLSIDSPQSDGWQHCLHALLSEIDMQALPEQARRVLEALHQEDPAVLEQDAAKILAGVYGEVDAARAPFIGAALQLYWTRSAFELGGDGRSPGVDARRCPVCGSPPVGGIIRIGRAEHGLRYLACCVCGSEWHLVRVKCSACGSTQNISYLYVDGANDAVRAECCDDCKTYLKIFYLEKDRYMEPVADDLATLALDILVDEQGYRRVAPNLLLAPGIER